MNSKVLIPILVLFLIVIVSGCTQEGISQEDPSCITNWNCTEWDKCEGNWISASQPRTCNDLNGCNISSGKPSETQVCVMPKTTSKEPSELALQLSDIPEGYEIVERGERLKSDVSDEARDRGWKEGYYVYFREINEDNVWVFTKINQHNSIYPIENMTKVIDSYNNTEEVFEEDYTKEVISDPKIGDWSMATRTRWTENSFEYTDYNIIFIKMDVYVYLSMWGTTGIDYELMKELAQKIANKIN